MTNASYLFTIPKELWPELLACGTMGMIQAFVMALVNPPPWQIEILVPVCAGLLILQFLLMLRIGSRVKRLERLVRVSRNKDELLRNKENGIDERGGPFDEYLSENPQRRNLSRAEQLEGYRRWRKERGLSWTAS